MQLIGNTLGQYRIVEQIGQGGMATVYKAFQASLDRFVAIKILPAHHAQKPEFKERFFREAQAVARLSHPNILPIYDVGMDEGICYFVMKIVQGNKTMRERLGRQMPLPLASRFVDQIAGALDHAHKEGIIHRDIKSSNLLMEGEWIYLTDFGIAKIMEASVALTSTGELMGTPSYMSPEQGAGKPVDNRTDIYSLGIVLYEMLTGTVPFLGETPYGVIYKHIHEPLPLPRAYRPDLPEAVERIVLKALAKDPEDRHQTAEILADMLREAVASTVLSARSPSPEQIAGAETTEIQSVPPSDLNRDTRVPPSRIDEISAPSAAESEALSDFPPHRDATEGSASQEVGRPSSASRRSFLYASGAILLASVLVYTVSFRGTLLQREDPGQSRKPDSSPTQQQASPPATPGVNRSAELFAQSIPSGAEVYIDGALKGKTPLKLELSPGKHAVRIANAGYLDWDKEINLNESTKYPVMAELEMETKTNIQKTDNDQQISPVSLFETGKKYYDGKVVPRDYQEAMKWFLKAAALGNEDAKNYIGFMFCTGTGVKLDYSEAMLWFRRAAEQGNSIAQKNIGLLYKNGLGIGKNYQAAMKWFLKAGEQGQRDAQFQIGVMYDNGWGVGKDSRAAAKWFLKAAEQGLGEAQDRIGMMYAIGVGVDKDEQAAMRWFLKAAEQGQMDAQFHIGLMYDNGMGASKDYRTAMEWYLKAAEQGSSLAQFNIGIIYLHGRGVSKDSNEAMKWFLKAAEQGLSEAQNNIGSLYYNGIGVRKDYKKAMEWYMKAAQQGNVYSLVTIGTLLSG